MIEKGKTVMILLFFLISINPTFFYAFKKQLKSTKRFEIIFLFAKIYRFSFFNQAILLLISIGVFNKLIY
ncbi:hypothetical protein D9D13_01595 [Metamycoplasma hominis]|nr:hypothetical protein D9D13_01595 [Metamycoplasma hominis]